MERMVALQSDEDLAWSKLFYGKLYDTRLGRAGLCIYYCTILGWKWIAHICRRQLYRVPTRLQKMES